MSARLSVGCEAGTLLGDQYRLVEPVAAGGCLAGRRSFSGETQLALALARLRQPPAPMPDDVSPHVLALVGPRLAGSASAPTRQASMMISTADYVGHPFTRVTALLERRGVSVRAAHLAGADVTGTVVGVSPTGEASPGSVVILTVAPAGTASSDVSRGARQAVDGGGAAGGSDATDGSTRPSGDEGKKKGKKND